jgi:hypothetical protein
LPSYSPFLDVAMGTVRGRHGRHKIIPQKNVEKIIKFIKYFVEVNKNEVNKKPKNKIKQSLHHAEIFNITAVKDPLIKRQK